MMNRRNFIRESSKATAALTLTNQTFSVFNRPGSPAKKLRVAVMGVNSRGEALASNLAQFADTEVAYICDVDRQVLDRVVAKISKLQNKTPQGEKDVRKVLEDKDLDALVIAAPDHWHAPAAILGMQAGKHVFVEKPCSHNPREGELLIQAVNKYKRVFQMGNQRRSWVNINKLIGDLRGGVIGEVYMAKGWYANNRGPIGYGKTIPVPSHLDYELWQGPAPRKPYKDNLIHYNWHWFRHWGTGEALNNGTHEIDVMRWGLGVGLPTRVLASGGRYHYHDDWEFPDTAVINFEFEDKKLITWEQRSCNNLPIEGDGRGVIFYGSGGSVVVGGGDGYTVFDDKNKVTKTVKPAQAASGSSTNTTSPDANLDGIHLANFLEAIRTGAKNNSPVEEAHSSVLCCQLGNIAWFTGRILNIHPTTGHIIGDKEAMHYWSRTYEPGWEPHV